MPALPPYIPTKDSAFDAWANNFATLIDANPPLYGLNSTDAAAIEAAYIQWNTAYLLVTSPSTKTRSTVAAKDTARITALATLRPYAQGIANNAGVTPANKTALGLNPRTSTPVPITAPTTNPVLTVTQSMSLQTVIRYRDSIASPSVKSKPYGVIQLQLFGVLSATPITDPTALQLLNVYTKSPLIQTWPAGSGGKTAYVAGRWLTKKGLIGPWSPIISTTVVA
jgi:hypothetical protein